MPNASLSKHLCNARGLVARSVMETWGAAVRAARPHGSTPTTIAGINAGVGSCLAMSSSEEAGDKDKFQHRVMM